MKGLPAPLNRAVASPSIKITRTVFYDRSMVEVPHSLNPSRASQTFIAIFAFQFLDIRHERRQERFIHLRR